MVCALGLSEEWLSVSRPIALEKGTRGWAAGDREVEMAQEGRHQMGWGWSVG